VKQYDLVFKNGMVVSENGTMKADLAVYEGKIAEVSEEIPNERAKQIYEAENLFILPGLIDSHVHFNEPGRTDWEGFRTGSMSLAAGGVTTFFDMPLNSSPPTTTVKAFIEKKKLGDEKSLINFRLWGGVTPGNLDQLEDLKDCGVIGFKAFLSESGIPDFSRCDDETLFRGMEKIAALDMVLAIHAESDPINQPLTKRMIGNGRLSGRDYSESRPISSEIEAVLKVISLAQKTGCKIHIVHVSSSQVVEKMREAKLAGVGISVETCPHYLSLTADDVDKIGAAAKCAPPLRDEWEVEQLWDFLKRGDIDTIGSDHSPAPIEMKQGNIFEAWGGISGAQTTLNILLEEGFWKRKVPLETIVKLTSSAPARRFNLFPKKGSLTLGSDADLTVIDLSQSFMLRKEDLFYKNQYSPYLGKKFHGVIVSTFVHGKRVYQNVRGN
jgi:allantoinase